MAERKQDDVPPAPAAGTPESRGLNPGAVEFVPGKEPKPAGGGKARGHRGGGKEKKEKGNFHMNPAAVPWQPVTRRSTASSAKPLIFVLGAPGGEGEALVDALAKEFNGAAYSTARTRRAVAQRRKVGFYPASTMWSDTRDIVDDVDEFLASTVSDDVAAYFMDVNARNSNVYQYITQVLRKPKYNLAPGLFLYIEKEKADAKTLIANMVAKGEDEEAAKALVDHYMFAERDRRALLGRDGKWEKEAKGLMKWVSAADGPEKLLEAARAHCQALFEICQRDKILSYDLPLAAPPAAALFPVLNVDEYHHALSTIDAKVCMGDTRFPLAKDNGLFVVRKESEVNASATAQSKDGASTTTSISYDAADATVINVKAPPADATPRPTAKSHYISRKVEGTRYLLLYTETHDDPDQGRFYLVPKSMEMCYTIRPRIKDIDFERGRAPIYGTPGSLNTFIIDGTLAATKTGWCGLVGPGLVHYLFIAGDILYSSAEPKPSDKISRSDAWPLERRLGALSRACVGWPKEEAVAVRPSDNEILTLAVKNYYPLSSLGHLLDHIQDDKDSYTSLGLTFTPTRKYIPFVDPQLISWHLFRHRTLHLRIKRNREKEGGYLLLAKKRWGGDDEVTVGTVAHSLIQEGTVVCRAVWKGSPGGPYAWDIRDTAPDCWEQDAVKKYLEPQYWVNSDLLRRVLHVEPAEETKVKVEKVNDSGASTSDHPREGGGRGGGRGRGR